MLSPLKNMMRMNENTRAPNRIVLDTANVARCASKEKRLVASITVVRAPHDV